MSVTAVMPAYNGAEFIADAVESIYAQTLLPEEVIVVDDGSTDDTPAVLSRFEGRPGFRAVYKANGGSASARNAGVELATGEFVALLDQDDVWKPEKLERQLAEFDSAWGMSFTRVDYTTTIQATSHIKEFESWDPDPRTVVRLLEGSCAVGPTSTVLMRRDALIRVGPFEKVSPFGDDWLMWLRFASAGNRIGYVPERLTEYRWHGANASGDESAFFDAACEVFDLYGDRRLRAWRRLLAAVYAHDHRDPSRARRRLLEAAHIRPWSVRPGWLRLLF